MPISTSLSPLTQPSISSLALPIAPLPLILARSRLARFLPQICQPLSRPTVQGKYTHQLIQIPRANLHVASILLQAVAKPLCRLLTALLPPAIVVIALLSLRSDRIIVRLPLRYFTTAGMATTEHTADSMANRRADCDAAVGRSASNVGLRV
jgi:hypothetical protein